MKVELTEEQIKFLEMMSTKIITDKGNEYFYMPYWYKRLFPKNQFEQLTFDYLPDDLKEQINKMRNPK